MEKSKLIMTRKRRPRELEEDNKMEKEKEKEKKMEAETETETDVKTENIVKEHDSKKSKNQDKKKKVSKTVEINNEESENSNIEKNKIRSKSTSTINAENVDLTEESTPNKKSKLDKKTKKKSQCQHSKNKKVDESNAKEFINVDDIEEDKDKVFKQKMRYVDNKVNGETRNERYEYNYEEEEKESTLVSGNKVECEENQNFEEEHGCCFNKENVDEEVNV
ncbi:uncharacterized protein DDB_G0283697-like [Vespula pensylvanica]|uniref:uncharacterized protein DDB_G0283697-like n=1 Tax=Vespula pensylvanica TaxID=30213 RepID=UPI001CBA2EA0|nr:uncharacterized protein DDB_G0283697-like [Vespula pensylvanica]